MVQKLLHHVTNAALPPQRLVYQRGTVCCAYLTVGSFKCTKIFLMPTLMREHERKILRGLLFLKTSLGIKIYQKATLLMKSVLILLLSRT
jgi:hypothetical protein